MSNVNIGSIVNFDLFKDKNTAVIDTPTSGDNQQISLFETIEKGINNASKVDTTGLVQANPNNNAPAETSYAQSNKDYLESYDESNNALRGVVAEIDSMQGVLNEELTKVRSSKTMSKKYDYISSLAVTKSNLIGNKIAAIREINNNITQSHNLALKRQKDLKISNEEDGEKQVIDLYKSFIATPKNDIPNFITDRSFTSNIGSYNSQITGDIINVNEAPLTPQQNMMLLESNPNIKTVLYYEQNTGRKWFDVIDISTGQSVPNVDKPTAIMLENLIIDSFNGIARDSKLDITYPLILV